MEMLQLFYFFLSAKNQNFSTTAKMFDVPTTAVSSSVRRLEEELGCKLFDRTHNRIILNAKGQRFQQALCTVFAELFTVTASTPAATEIPENRSPARALSTLIAPVVYVLLSR